MSDFFQPGVVTTFHRLKKVNLDRMEAELEFYSRYNPIALFRTERKGAENDRFRD
jgi:hypothetical protein